MPNKEDKRKGNQFWKLRSKHGRDRIFSSPDVLWDAACEYFEWCESTPIKEQKTFHSNGKITKTDENKLRPFSLHGLCLFLDVNTKYFNEFEEALSKKEELSDNDKGFSDIITRIRETIYIQKFEGAATNLLNASIIARELQLPDNVNSKLSGDTDNPVTSQTVIFEIPNNRRD